MAVTITPIADPTELKLSVDTDADATAERDIFLGAATPFMFDIDNAANGSAMYFKGYNAKTPTVGTDLPELILLAPASTRIAYLYASFGSEGRVEGAPFDTAFSHACVSTGGTGGTTSPGANVTARIAAN